MFDRVQTPQPSLVMQIMALRQAIRCQTLWCAALIGHVPARKVLCQPQARAHACSAVDLNRDDCLPNPKSGLSATQCPSARRDC